MEPSTIIYPVINLNGTSSNELIEQNKAVWSALETALQRMREAMPHGRDFQTAGGMFIAEKAQEQRRGWMAEVEKIQANYVSIIEDLIIQDGSR